MKLVPVILSTLLLANSPEGSPAQDPTSGKKLPYPIVDTGQGRCFDDRRETPFPKKDSDYFGQDGHYEGNVPAYRDNNDGTISDLVTGLMWTKSPGEKMSLDEALAGAKSCRTGGYRDWRVPTIKELYSLILFSGLDPDPESRDSSKLSPFIDTDYFTFRYGDESKGERIIDSQYGSSTKYVSTTMKGDATLFGVDFADGRIKGYGLKNPRNRSEPKTFFFIFARGNPDYGKNDFRENRDGTITDRATGLTWMKVDSGELKAGKKRDGKMNWKEALEWAENLEYAGHSDWRLPNLKELQSIVDYTRSPKTTKSPAIDPLFKLSEIIDEGGKKNYPCYWSGSSHVRVTGAQSAGYIAFGEGLGWMSNRRTGKKTLMDVHGAGCQRSDSKSGDPSKIPYGRGPQGDVVRIYNHVICVRGGEATLKTSGPEIEKRDDTERKGGSSKFITRLDKDGDGKISRDEFDGPKRHFDRLDKDGDGFLNEEEVPKGPPGKGRKR